MVELREEQQQQQQEKPAHLEPSELGTKEYWDNLYINEISNHAHDPDDRGTVWFDDSDAEAKMIDFLNRLDPDFTGDDDDDDDSYSESDNDEQEQEREGGVHNGHGSSSSSLSRIPPLPRLDQKTTSFLDLGTGNGSLLFGLRDAGWRGKMLGVDYSPKSVEFARQIARARREQEEGQGGRQESGGDDNIGFEEYDILNGQPESLLAHLSSASSAAAASSPSTTTTGTAQRQGGGDSEKDSTAGWDVILDKGTFDAISLSSATASTTTTTSTTTRRPNEGYKAAVLPLVREEGLFLITSCNWTEDELSRWFEGDFDQNQIQQQQQQQSQEWRFKRVGKVKYPTFSFGGVKGQTISTLCFVKVRR